MIDFIKKHFKLFEIIVIFILSLTPLLWLRDGQIILGHDSGFRLNPVAHLVNLFYSWDPSNNFGADWSWFKGFLITQTPEAFFISLAKSFEIGQLLTFIFWFFCIGISMYIFVNAFYKEKKHWFFRLFASTFYMYNFFLLQGWFIVERAKFSLFIVLPLGILFIYKTLVKEYSVLKGVILFSLTSFLFNAGGNTSLYGASLLGFGITFIYLTFVNVRKGGYKEIVYSIKMGLLFSIGFLAINSYWILPQLYSFFSGYSSTLLSVGGINSILEWETVITKNASILNLLRLQGMPDWYDNNLHTYAYLFVKNPLLIVFSFFPIVILFFGFLNHKILVKSKKENGLITLMLWFFLFGLFFTAGSHPPFGVIYIFLIEHLPGFAIFRSAFYKFGGIFWFSYIFIISFYLNLFLLKIVKRKIIYIFLTVFSICFILAYHFPFFSGNFFTWNKPFATKVTVPNYVNEMADYINKLPSNVRILLLPAFYNQADSYRWGFWGIDSLPRLSTNKSIVANSANSPEIISAIYSSISQNEEDTFFRLTGSAGITEVLWRDDVLYSDKTTTSKNFSQIKKNLENFNGIKFEKKFGAWSLYEIDSAYDTPIIHGIDSIIFAQSELSDLSSIYSQEENPKNAAILFAQSMNDKDNNILSSANKNIIGAKCIACGLETFSQTKGGLLMPETIILPSSPFYYLFFLREQQVQNLHKNNPALRIDADLGYSNKRISEMKEIANAKVKTLDESFYVTQAIAKYKILIKDALGQANLLPDDKRNEALMKISIYLNSQYWFLGIQKNLYDYALEDFESLSVFIQETITNLGNEIWSTNLAENKIRYFLKLDSSGMYDLNVVTRGLQMQAISVDGKNLTEFKNLAFDKGIHKIEISYPVIENLIDASQATESGELRLRFGERVEMPIKDFNPKETYYISFDYKISQGRPNASIIESGKDKQSVWNLLLNQNSVWNSFGSSFKSNQDTESVNLEFYPTGFEITGATIQVQNIKVVKIYTPDVFVSKKVTPLVVIKPSKVSFSRLDATTYKANIESSTSPFMLNFGESFSKDWRAYIIEGTQKNDYGKNIVKDFFQTLFLKPIPETQHYSLNGYSNGWLINKQGSYIVIIKFFPQEIFYAGLIISGLCLFVIILILAKKRKAL